MHLIYFMTKQVTFHIDNDIKKKAQKRAKDEGLSLKAVLVFSLKAYSEGKIQFGISNDNLEFEKIDITEPDLLKKIDKLEALISDLDKKDKLPKGSLSQQLSDL